MAGLAMTYIRWVAPSIIIYVWSESISEFATGQGKPRYSLYSTFGASVGHACLAYYLAVSCDLKMTGIAAASAV
jgi:Na+-driven multidrug efflux pump